ncbi:hypothetical protein FRX31_006258 [Thalictrum thalictroides]|uniref:Uncharacterized protein n=1 Tax=Thalictrum thalictroides TaxID=46969 RepID=A0A7J6X325_THATH|nr:hypothetical protein FRX31_006258 [Thalictrum thalictroides]
MINQQHSSEGFSNGNISESSEETLEIEFGHLLKPLKQRPPTDRPGDHGHGRNIQPSRLRPYTERSLSRGHRHNKQWPSIDRSLSHQTKEGETQQTATSN